MNKMLTYGEHLDSKQIRCLYKRYFAAPMRQIVVPQSGHLPFVIGLPFLVTPSTGSCMVFFALHFTQYASIAIGANTSLSNI